jgi:hypothetical protein
VFVHPECPCTSATLDELERLLTHEAGRIETTVAVVTPASKVEEWKRTRITRLASRIPGVALYTDVGGREARRFGAMTSGFTLLYGADGRLRFAGGITASRGEAGDNLGAIAIEDVVEHQPSPRDTTQVFGCELHDPPAQPGGRP